MTTQQLEMRFELFLRSSVGKRSSRQVRQALPDGQIQALDERRIQCRGVLGVFERFFESPRRSVNGSSLDFHDAIVPARLEDLTIESRLPEDATDSVTLFS